MIKVLTSLFLLCLATIAHGASSTTMSTLPLFLPTIPNEVVATVNDGSKTCIIYNAGVRFAFNYTNNLGQIVIGQTDLPDTGFNVTGACGQDNQTLNIYFNDNWELTYQFTIKEGQWWVYEVTMQYYLNPGQPPFPDITSAVNGTATMKNDTWYQTTNGSSYQCVVPQSMNSSVPAPDFVGMTTVNLQIEAFRQANNTQFSNPIGCPADQVSNIVPIAVGAALGALVIIVLIAYFIGRARNKRGYESV